MKNYFFYLLTLISMTAETANALTNVFTYERPLIGIQAGLNFETASSASPISSSSRTGFTVGTALEIPLNVGVSIQPELNYSRRTFNLASAAGLDANVNYHSL